jgi:hypothetical protein
LKMHLSQKNTNNIDSMDLILMLWTTEHNNMTVDLKLQAAI